MQYIFRSQSKFFTVQIRISVVNFRREDAIETKEKPVDNNTNVSIDEEEEEAGRDLSHAGQAWGSFGNRVGGDSNSVLNGKMVTGSNEGAQEIRVDSIDLGGMMPTSQRFALYLHSRI